MYMMAHASPAPPYRQKKKKVVIKKKRTEQANMKHSHLEIESFSQYAQ